MKRTDLFFKFHSPPNSRASASAWSADIDRFMLVCRSKAEISPTYADRRPKLARLLNGFARKPLGKPKLDPKSGYFHSSPWHSRERDPVPFAAKSGGSFSKKLGQWLGNFVTHYVAKDVTQFRLIRRERQIVGVDIEGRRLYSRGFVNILKYQVNW